MTGNGELSVIVGQCSKGRVYMDGLVKPGADFQYIYSQAAKLSSKPLILVAGTNYPSERTPQPIFNKMESYLKSFSISRPVCITTIPPTL